MNIYETCPVRLARRAYERQCARALLFANDGVIPDGLDIQQKIDISAIKRSDDEFERQIKESRGSA
jgi:hypothetical protein